MAIIFGLGFTGERLAQRLLTRGVDVFAPVRGVERFPGLANAGLRLCKLNLLESCLESPVDQLPSGARIALLIPPLSETENARLRNLTASLAPARIVYVSSTGVYGDQTAVDADTPVAPNDERGKRRMEEERWIASGPWSSLILRAAAIYGPGRGVHAAVRDGRVPRGADSGVTSRIHVDDLAAIVEAGLFSELGGTWPIADEEPCASADITRWYLERSHLMPPERTDTGTGLKFQGRRVDGQKIREMLGVELRYPTWRTGVPASIQEEELLADRAVRVKPAVAKRP